VRETRDWAGISFDRVAPGAHISQVTLSINVYDAPCYRLGLTAETTVE